MLLCVPAASSDDIDTQVLIGHMELLNELSERRRSSTFFANPQSVFHGVPIRYVNSSRGNLTFARRDLVTVGRIPVVLARVYDSSRTGGGDFGPGWHLALAETIERQDDGSLRYLDDTASERTLVQVGATQQYMTSPRSAGNIDRLEVDDSEIRIHFGDGWRKRFNRMGGGYHLTAIHDPHGNSVSLHYAAAQLVRVDGQNGRFVTLERDAFGRVVRISDDQERTVSYDYDAQGRLESVADLGGHLWRYVYDDEDRLTHIIDPMEADALTVEYDAANRVVTSRVRGLAYRYAYGESATEITNIDGGRMTRVSHHPSGMAVAVTNPQGFASRLELDDHEQVTAVLHDERPRAAMSYDSLGRIERLERFDPHGRSAPGADRLRAPPAGGHGGHGPGDAHGDQAGDLRYNAAGDIESLVHDGETLHFSHNADGQVETIEGPRGQVALRYHADGKLATIEFADGFVHRYAYNALGLRSRVERSDGTHASYTYDGTGNLTRVEGIGADGRDAGLELGVDAAHRVATLTQGPGARIAVDYDAHGNPVRVAYPEQAAEPLQFHYDESNRVVAVAEGARILGRYSYEPAEPDLRLQHDRHSRPVDIDAVSRSAVLGNLPAVLYARPRGAYVDQVRFDEATGTLDVAAADRNAADAVVLSSLMRRQLLAATAGTVEVRTAFDRASNAIFLPAEYATINCTMECSFPSVIASVDGQTGTATVTAGVPVTMTATPGPGMFCFSPPVYFWSVEGTFPAGQQVNYTFNNTGTVPVWVTGECCPDQAAQGFVSVNVSGSSCPLGAAYEFHTGPNANFANRGSFYPIVIGGTSAHRTITLSLEVNSSTTLMYEEFKSWIEQAWNKTVILCDTTYQIQINLTRNLLGQSPWLTFKRIITLPPKDTSDPHLCGVHSSGPMQVSELVMFQNDVCNQATTVAHEFGHELGFDNAYEVQTLFGQQAIIPLHSQVSDIMNAGGTEVLGAHGRILVEEYGN